MARFGACDQIALLLLAVSMARDLSWASPQQNAVMACELMVKSKCHHLIQSACTCRPGSGRLAR